jgi:hypothetical protein
LDTKMTEAALKSEQYNPYTPGVTSLQLQKYLELERHEQTILDQRNPYYFTAGAVAAVPENGARISRAVSARIETETDLNFQTLGCNPYAPRIGDTVDAQEVEWVDAFSNRRSVARSFASTQKILFQSYYREAGIAWYYNDQSLYGVRDFSISAVHERFHLKHGEAKVNPEANAAEVTALRTKGMIFVEECLAFSTHSYTTPQTVAHGVRYIAGHEIVDFPKVLGRTPRNPTYTMNYVTDLFVNSGIIDDYVHEEQGDIGKSAERVFRAISALRAVGVNEIEASRIVRNYAAELEDLNTLSGQYTHTQVDMLCDALEGEILSTIQSRGVESLQLDRDTLIDDTGRLSQSTIDELVDRKELVDQIRALHIDSILRAELIPVQNDFMENLRNSYVHTQGGPERDRPGRVITMMPEGDGTTTICDFIIYMKSRSGLLDADLSVVRVKRGEDGTIVAVAFSEDEMTKQYPKAIAETMKHMKGVSDSTRSAILNSTLVVPENNENNDEEN